MVNHLKGSKEAKEMELRELKNHFVICGWNRSGKIIVKELQAEVATSCAPIVIITEMEEPPVFDKNKVNLGMIHFVRDDYTSRDVLKKVQIDKARAAILLADKSKPRSDQDRDARTILAALIIEKLSPGIFTSAELLQRENQVHLSMADVEDVVVGDEYMGNLIAHSSRTWGLVKVMDELLTSTRGNQFYKTKAPGEIIGLKLKDALGIIKEQYDGIIFSIETEDIPPGGEPKENIQMVSSRRIITNPPNDYVIKEDDAIIIIAEKMPTVS
ncbi:MAG: TrkA-related ion transporter [Myxococcota bacterium]